MMDSLFNTRTSTRPWPIWCKKKRANPEGRPAASQSMVINQKRRVARAPFMMRAVRAAFHPSVKRLL